MFTLPEASHATLKKWQGMVIEGHDLTGFSVAWCGEPFNGTLTKGNIKPKNVFILRQADYFKYAAHDSSGFKEIPEKWYSKCFLKVSEIPSENIVTVCVNGSYVDLPFLPHTLFNRKTSAKRRKKVHRVDNTAVYPIWEHREGKTIHFKVAKSFKEIFDKADSNEITLQDPFEGYESMDEIKATKTGRLAFKTVAGFIYYHCRDNLGYPLNLNTR
jgi:hypothetical protein